MPCLSTPDPNENNGLMTKVWGPAGWLFLHCVTFGYPVRPTEYDLKHGKPVGSTRESYRRFFYEVGNIFPCRYCRDSYIIFVRENPIEPHLDSRDALVAWFWAIHNKVTDKLGVTYCDATLEEVRKRYETYRAKCKSPTENERAENKEKGCVRPVDGEPKQCKIDVVKTSSTECIKCNLGKVAVVGFLFAIGLWIGYRLGIRQIKKK